MNPTRRLFVFVQLVFSFASFFHFGQAQIPQGSRSVSTIAVGPQYDTTHIYVAPSDLNAFIASFLGTFGGQSTKQVVATVTPTPSSTTSQLLQTPVGTVSLFGFKTPIPAPFGAERTGYLISNMDEVDTSVSTQRIDHRIQCVADNSVTPFYSGVDKHFP